MRTHLFCDPSFEENEENVIRPTGITCTKALRRFLSIQEKSVQLLQGTISHDVLFETPIPSPERDLKLF
jgi:hypothetical protein